LAESFGGTLNSGVRNHNNIAITLSELLVLLTARSVPLPPSSVTLNKMIGTLYSTVSVPSNVEQRAADSTSISRSIMRAMHEYGPCATG
jgi:hypothetical protein